MKPGLIIPTMGDTEVRICVKCRHHFTEKVFRENHGPHTIIKHFCRENPTPYQIDYVTGETSLASEYDFMECSTINTWGQCSEFEKKGE